MSGTFKDLLLSIKTSVLYDRNFIVCLKVLAMVALGLCMLCN